jgi:hypothetical protein
MEAQRRFAVPHELCQPSTSQPSVLLGSGRARTHRSPQATDRGSIAAGLLRAPQPRPASASGPRTMLDRLVACRASQVRGNVHSEGAAAFFGARRCCRCVPQAQALHSYHNTVKLIHQKHEGASEAKPAGSSGQLGRRKGRGAQQRSPPDGGGPSAGSDTSSSASGNGILQSSDAVVAAETRTGQAAAAEAQVQATAPNRAGAGRRSPAHTHTGPGASAHGTDHAASQNRSQTGSNGTAAGLTLSGLRPYAAHAMSLPAWQPPPSSLQSRTALTRAISSCRTYTQLHAMIVDNSSEFNAYHTTAALSRMLDLQAAGLSPRESRQFKEGCSVITASGVI